LQVYGNGSELCSGRRGRRRRWFAAARSGQRGSEMAAGNARRRAGSRRCVRAATAACAGAAEGAGTRRL